MLEIVNKKGNVVKVFARTFEKEAYDQVVRMCNYEPYLDSKIRIMPDAHAGSGCVIGTTIQLKDKVTPNLVGVDIGCGMLVARLAERDIDLQKLDMAIRLYIPNGMNIHNESKMDFGLDLHCASHVNEDRVRKSLGTLGGGNHFIEVDRGSDGKLYIVIHSGSRHLGVDVCRYYQNEAFKALSSNKEGIDQIIATLKAEGREREIQSALKNMKKKEVIKDLAYVEGDMFKNYIEDMAFTQYYASVNRWNMMLTVSKIMGFMPFEKTIETIHNYIDPVSFVLRKGAVSARKGESLIIPMNMRDGSLLCIGKGNPDWNFSAPHGAGRLMSRTKAKENIKMNDFKKAMDGIYSTSVCEETIDEAPQVYKPMSEILGAIGDTVEVVDIIKPIYNFKAHE